jgi:purine-binding chemotaxis protein CheW
MASAAASLTEEQLVVFRLDTENYGIDIFRVNEIIRLREITPLPQTDAHLKGLVNLRGKTIPVVDLRIRFGLPENEEGETTRIIVVDTDSGNVGIVVDEVCEVLTLDDEEREDTPVLVADNCVDYVRGVAKRDSRLITLLDLDKVLVA